MTINKNDKQKILIVDDEVDITTALKMYLELQGFHVDTFTDSANALAHFKAGFYQLLIIDIKMVGAPSFIITLGGSSNCSYLFSRGVRYEVCDVSSSIFLFTFRCEHPYQDLLSSV
jgi:CheY-like chemotaxis protein